MVSAEFYGYRLRLVAVRARAEALRVQGLLARRHRRRQLLRGRASPVHMQGVQRPGAFCSHGRRDRCKVCGGREAARQANAARAEAAQAAKAQAKAARAEAAQAAMAARAEAAQAARAEAKAARAEAAQAAKKPRAHTWSPAEDAQLARAALRGCRGRAQMPWTLIAAEVEGRDADACRKRWVNQLCPQLNHSGVWSEAEDAALLRLVEQHGNKYAEMTRLLGTRRSENAVKNRVLKLTCVASFGALPDAACVLQTPAIRGETDPSPAPFGFVFLSAHIKNETQH